MRKSMNYSACRSTSTIIVMDTNSLKGDDIEHAFKSSNCPGLRIALYKLVEQPTSSFWAKILAVISIAMIVFSFVIMVLQSMEQFCTPNENSLLASQKGGSLSTNSPKHFETLDVSKKLCV